MGDLAIRMEGISKRYKIGRQGRSGLGSWLAHGIGAILRSDHSPDPGRDEFWALDDVSVEVHRGEVVGIIGRNGAGKSTLLKILSRITRPTRGFAEIHGRTGSILEVGTGFHPELTGRENIFLNGSILGMRRTEIRRKLDEIVAFSGTEKFLDTPVKRYSSGMYVRLAFAVAAQLEPEILIVDEVLAVGDAEFQQRCLGRMGEVAKVGRTVLFVSHNLGAVKTLCGRALLLDGGRVRLDGTATAAVEEYLRSLEKCSFLEISKRSDRQGKGEARLRDLAISDGEIPSSTLATGRPARFAFHVDRPLPGMYCIFTIYDHIGQPVASFNSSVRGPDDSLADIQSCSLICTLDELPLRPGRYRINVAIMSGLDLQDHLEGAAIFEVAQGQMRGRPATSNGGYGSICIAHRWMQPAIDARFNNES